MLRGTKYPLLAIILFSCICIYEIIVMFPSKSDEFSPSLYNLSVIGIVTTSTIYFGLNIKQISNNKATVYLTSLLIYIWFVSILWGGFPTKLLYIETLAPLTVFLASTIASKHSTRNFFLLLTIVLFIVLVLFYLSNMQTALVDSKLNQNNAAYSIILFLPFILCINNRNYRIIGIILILSMLIISLKRGGIIAFFCAMIIYYTISYKTKNVTLKIIVSLLSIIIAIVIGNIIIEQSDNRFISQLVTRFEGIQDDKGSGRFQIYETVLNEIQKSSFINLIMGHGWDQVKNIPGLRLSAHNDFIEILYDFGLIALFLFILFLIKLIQYDRFLSSRRINTAGALGASIAVTLILTTVSHIVIYPKYLLLSCLFWGYIFGKSDQLLKRKNS